MRAGESGSALARRSAAVRDRSGRLQAVPLTANRPGRQSSLRCGRSTYRIAIPVRQGSQPRTKKSGEQRAWPLIMTGVQIKVRQHLADNRPGCGDVTQAEAEAVIAGFAFGTTQLTWSSKVASSAERELAAEPRATARSMWSYRTYDCVPNSPYVFGVTDLLAVAALDAGARAAQSLAIEAILPPDLRQRHGRQMGGKAA
jgi:hypothetical protein